jgi:hypothetical protein
VNVVLIMTRQTRSIALHELVFSGPFFIAFCQSDGR